MPPGFGVWQTVYDRFLRWRDVGVFQALMEGMIAEAARRGQTGLSLVSTDSTVARAHHDAAGMRVDGEILCMGCDGGLERRVVPGADVPPMSVSGAWRSRQDVVLRIVRPPWQTRACSVAERTERIGCPQLVHTSLLPLLRPPSKLPVWSWSCGI
jgi:hypothetical protein